MKRTIALAASILLAFLAGPRARGEDYALSVIERSRVEWPRYVPGEPVG